MPDGKLPDHYLRSIAKWQELLPSRVERAQAEFDRAKAALEKALHDRDVVGPKVAACPHDDIESEEGYFYIVEGCRKCGFTFPPV